MTPSFLYYLFAVAMYVVSAISGLRLIEGIIRRRTVGWDIDVLHFFMGISMAGMFVPKWAFGADVVWESIFVIALVWFVTMSIQSFRAFGAHLSHYLIHAVMSVAMLLMYWYPGGTGSSGSMSMGMSASSGSHSPQQALVFPIVLVLLISAVRTLGIGERGRSHHGAHPPVYSDPSVDAVGHDAGAGASVRLWPLVEDVDHVVMCVAMAFMLILML